MVLTIIIFLIAITLSFSMIIFRAWELRTGRAHLPEEGLSEAPDFSFRQVEKSMLYLTKHVVQGIVLVVAKYWFIAITKIKKWMETSLPKVNSYFEKKPEQVETSKVSFVRRAILESQAKIKRVKEKVKKEQEEKEEIQES